MDLPARWDTDGLASVELVASRARHGCDLVAETPHSYNGRHFAAGEVTQEFRRIVAAEWGVHRCESCTVGWEGEPMHASCPGCSCPCSTVDSLPEGVEGHAIAGGTR